VTPQIALQTAAREAIIRPKITRTVGLIHRAGPLSPAGRAFLALATQGS
jgi:hypothetical protein